VNKKKGLLILFTIIIVVAFSVLLMKFIPQLVKDSSLSIADTKKGFGIIKLPQPRFESNISLEEAVLKRRSRREYKDEPLTIEEISQLLWAAYGVTGKNGLRTAPSAGALYPLETYLVVGKVKDIPSGVYKYKPQEHELINITYGDKRLALRSASLDQEAVSEAPIIIVFAAVYERTTVKYGERGVRYVLMEVGHAAQNVYLQAEALNLGTVVIGAFDDDKVKSILTLEKKEEPLYIMPVGKKK
jgi:SagB-type dehydrogenase family enzyme